MSLDSLENKKIAVLGLGIENLALVRYLLKHNIKCEITICDKREEVKKKWIPARQNDFVEQAYAGMTKSRIKWQLGKNYNKNLGKFDVLFRAPGWPMEKFSIFNPSERTFVRADFQFSKKITSPMKLFFELCSTKNIIGVTGTKGKGTTASLIYEILKTEFERIAANGAQANEKIKKQVWLGGNIGVAPFTFIDKIKKTDWVVLELSSFQLEDMTVSPHIAVITNFYPEHLAPADPNNPNFHESLKDYRDAKFNIIKWQKKRDYVIFNFQPVRTDIRPGGFSIFKQIPIFNFQTKGKKIYFKKSKWPSKLIGEHNKENIAAAVEAAKIVGVKPEIIKKAVANFQGLEHRLEFVREVKGVKYYNDSFATAPEATVTALKAFAAPIVLFLGGADKNSDFSGLAEEVKRRTKFVILLKGAAAPRIKKELLRAGYKKNKIKLFNNINEAVKLAKEIAVRGDIVLLSTACASFGLFKNYKERGRLFKEAVKGIYPAE